MGLMNRINRILKEDKCPDGKEWCPVDKKCVDRGTGKGRGQGQGKSNGGRKQDGSGGGIGANRR